MRIQTSASRNPEAGVCFSYAEKNEDESFSMLSSSRIMKQSRALNLLLVGAFSFEFVEDNLA